MFGALSLCALWACSLVAGSGAAGQQAFTLDPPPGWEDVTASRKGPDVLIALKGPETSSFVLTRIPEIGLEDRGVTRALLIDILSGLNRKTGLGLTLAGNLADATFDNGLTAHYIRADYKGRPRLVLAVMEYGGTTLVGTLISSVPDILLPEVLGSLKAAAPSQDRSSSAGRALSLDGQLSFALPPGFRTRPATEREKKLGFVLALQGLDSELMVMKLVGEGTAVKEQPRIVKDTVLSVGGVEAESLSPVSLTRTPAGPDLVSAWARVKDAGGAGQFAAGYMPWGYWGYSILAKGPRAADLIAETFKGLSPGPSALPKLVAETPKIPMPRLALRKDLRFLYAALGLAVLAGLLAWKRRSGILR